MPQSFKLVAENIVKLIKNNNGLTQSNLNSPLTKKQLPKSLSLTMFERSPDEKRLPKNKF